METLEIGGTPVNEDCCQTGITENAARIGCIECTAYIAALRKVYGDPPTGSEFRIKAHQHDFGTYREVVFKYDPADPEASAYASKVEQGLLTWDEANFWKPVHYDSKGQPITVIENTALLDRTFNPRAHTCMGARNADHQPV